MGTVFPVTTDNQHMLGQRFWDDFYAAHDQVWSGEPSSYLVDWAASLPPGRALDVGSGEGSDAVWLARQGWEVTAIDVSAVAMQRGAALAAEAGRDVAARITWCCEDLRDWAPERGTFDLVTSQFMQLPPNLREAVFGRLAVGVARGGTFLVVGHHPVDLQAMPRGHGEMLFEAEEIATFLAPEAWEQVKTDVVARPFEAPTGATITVHDTILQARRIGA